MLSGLKAAGIGEIPVIVGGIIPPEDEARLKAMGVAAVYTPKDYDLTAIMADIVRVAETAAGLEAA